MDYIRTVKPLLSGDTIGLFSPSEPLTDERKIRMEPSLNLLCKNYNVRWGKNSFASQYYQAGTREERIADIIELLSDSNTKALLATWGGKNGSQLINFLPYELFKKRRIPVIGFSDTCVLLNPISVYSDIVTFYGPNIAGKLTESAHWDMSELRTGVYEPFGSTAFEKWQTIKSGKAEGVLYGGNLSTFTIALAGSACLKKMKDIIFFWESSAEPPQIIDQYLTGLENAGFFENVRGMIVGNTLYEEEQRKNRPLYDLLSEFGKRYNIPVVQVKTFGHCITENPMIPIGAAVLMDTESKEIKLLEKVVE